MKSEFDIKSILFDNIYRKQACSLYLFPFFGLYSSSSYSFWTTWKLAPLKRIAIKIHLFFYKKQLIRNGIFNLSNPKRLSFLNQKSWETSVICTQQFLSFYCNRLIATVLTLVGANYVITCSVIWEPKNRSNLHF